MLVKLAKEAPDGVPKRSRPEHDEGEHVVPPDCLHGALHRGPVQVSFPDFAPDRLDFWDHLNDAYYVCAIHPGGDESEYFSCLCSVR